VFADAAIANPVDVHDREVDLPARGDRVAFAHDEVEDVTAIGEPGEKRLPSNWPSIASKRPRAFESKASYRRPAP